MIMKKNIVIVPIIVTMFVVMGHTACSTNTSLLEDKKWFLVSYSEQNNLQDIIGGTEITATFDSSNDQLGGSAGCNTYGATYQIRGNTIIISEVYSTEMACQSPDGVMIQEQQYLKILAEAESYHLDQTILTIYSSGNQRLVFTADNP